jgi:16S rRNA (cytosine967-C5)-methyltransferase
MTPGARVAAAVDILDAILDGSPAEKALTSWARRSRFAGSKDRAAVRDHVIDALRRKRTAAAMGGAMTGRGLMLGLLRLAGADPAELMNGEGHALPPPLPEETGRTPEAGAEAGDIPDWLWPRWNESLGVDATACADALKDRAPVFLRVNLRKATVAEAADRLRGEGIETRPAPLSPTALEVVAGARGLRNSESFAQGIVELQDAASQAVVDALPLRDGMRVLDYCAGGGGKTLAMGARADLGLWAHDAAPARMRDLPARAARAGLAVTLTDAPERHGPYDLVLCDAPCSGSGSWRRAPEGKWLLTPEGLAALQDTQAAILDQAAALVSETGVLAYATCSMLSAENDDQIRAFVARNPDWRVEKQANWRVADGADGFFLALLTR